MQVSKRTLIAGAAVAAVGLASVGGVGIASAATSSSTSDGSGNTSIIDKIASKFNLNKSDVQAVFDQDRSEHRAQMQTEQKDRLAQAVTDGKLTQDQVDHITQALDEIDQLMANKTPDQQDDSARQQIKTKMDALRDWAKQNNVDMQYVGHGGGMRGGPGGHGRGSDDSQGSQSQSDDSGSTN